MEQSGLDADTPRIRLIKRAAYFIAIIGAITLLTALSVYAWSFGRNGVSQTPADWEALGAYVGGVVGAIVSVATLSALAATWYLQAKELELSRRAARRQLFEATFFQMMSQFADIASSIDFGGRRGRIAFQFMHASLPSPPVYPADVTPSTADFIRDVNHAFNDLYRRFEHDLGPYYRTLYHVFKFVNDENSLTQEEKVTYANLARARLSRYEIVLLFYDALTPRAKEFKPLLEAYGLLKHINVVDIKNMSYASLYTATAFMGTDERARYEKHEPLDREQISEALKLLLSTGGHQWWPNLNVAPAS